MSSGAILKKIVVVVLIALTIAGFYKVVALNSVQAWKQQMVAPGLLGKTVIIDPGHGGADPGAMVGKVREASLNMELALALKKKLEEKNIKVRLTREGDTGIVPDSYMTYAERWFILEQRKQFASDQMGHLLISIHVNSNRDKRASGPIVYFSDEISRRLAESIQKRLNALGMKNRSSEKSNFTIITDNMMPSVLIEAGFISNKRDLQILTSKTELVALAVYNGIDDYTESFEQDKSVIGGQQ